MTAVLDLATTGAGAARPTTSADARGLARGLLGKLLNDEWPCRAASVLPAFARRLRPAVARDAARLAALVGIAAPQNVTGLADLLTRWSTGAPFPAPAATAGCLTVPAAPPGLRAFAEPRFRALAAAARRLAERTGAKVLLHGSLASDDWTGYRDADLLVLPDAASCSDPERLLALRAALPALLRPLHTFDPLQHHGVFVAPFAELTAWPEHFLPAATLQRAVDLGGDGFRTAFAAVFDQAAARAEFTWLVDYFDRAAPPTDAYGWKALASVLMLVPAVWLAACGAPCWKGDSFARVAARVPADLWQPIEAATRLRATFRDPTGRWRRLAIRCAPNPRLFAHLLRDRRPLPESLRPTAAATLVARARDLVRHLAERLPTNFEAQDRT